ncbi:MAG: hypothetical protein QOJ64_2501 [Acidobacteriota bacterium]|nr:hypothetical protein [Acidobacteriota bacterium]
MPPRRTATFRKARFLQPASLWLNGNARLLDSRLACVRRASAPNHHARNELEAIEKEAEGIVLGIGVLVCGVHHAFEPEGLLSLRASMATMFSASSMSSSSRML